MEAGTGALPLPCGHTDPAQGAITAPRVGLCAGTSLHPRVLQCGQQETRLLTGFPCTTGIFHTYKGHSWERGGQGSAPSWAQISFGGIIFPNQL